MQSVQDFDDIRPYRDDEIPQVIERLYSDPVFDRVLTNLYKDEQRIAGIKIAMLQTKTVESFQTTFMVPFLDNILNTSTDGIRIGGLENLDKKESYLFISNHRDIILDSALLNVEMYKVGYNTTEIAIGSNLLIYQWINDLVRINRSFVVKRNIPVKQMLLESKKLSHYIRHTISTGGDSIWIAQREGRSKDGNDQTQSALLKMLNMSNNQSFEAGFSKLKIVPMAISYEIEPCGNEKVAELLKRQADPDFQKTEKDDLWSMVSGLKNHKGQINIQFGKPLSKEVLEAIPEGDNINERLKNLASYIDKRIYKNYKLFPNNYIAYDLCYKCDKYSDKYTLQQKDDYIALTHQRLKLVNEDRDEAMELWLKMYSMPVYNFENCNCNNIE
jgi:1-acyl-sn-glycerol-3-phosphate acyltransferase